MRLIKPKKYESTLYLGVMIGLFASAVRDFFNIIDGTQIKTLNNLNVMIVILTSMLLALLCFEIFGVEDEKTK